MGRRPWATPNQTEFLESYIPNLDHEKQKEGGLKNYYERISLDFLEKWPAKPTDEDREETNNELELQALANAQRTRVSVDFVLLYKQSLTRIASKYTSGLKGAISKSPNPRPCLT